MSVLHFYFFKLSFYIWKGQTQRLDDSYLFIPLYNFNNNSDFEMLHVWLFIMTWANAELFHVLLFSCFAVEGQLFSLQLVVQLLSVKFRADLMKTMLEMTCFIGVFDARSLSITLVTNALHFLWMLHNKFHPANWTFYNAVALWRVQFALAITKYSLDTAEERLISMR